ncbi:probable D-arabinono-1,4-lactone oxidase at N-terminal half [Coccomyxa sp. Obi]|nr:probable D-arabinono-1,4-lactone oxidase at N-terminal half [Coccomyxa sp. Obi]
MGYYRCANDVAIGKPKNVSELLQIIKSYDRVKGVEHSCIRSWWQQQFCAGNDSNAVGIVTTEMTNTLAEILDPSYAEQSQADASFPIRVNEDTRTVRVQAGITQRILLDYLANYTSANAPYGYVLPAFAWYVDQTVGGAVSTGTHGSTMFWGSLSSQAVRVVLALANGTLLELTPDNNQHLWRAGQLAVGRLGIVTEIDFKIVPQRLLTRTVETQSFDDFVAWTMAAQERFKAAVASGSQTAISDSLRAVDQTQLFWFVPLNQTFLITYNSSDIPREFVDGMQPEISPAGPNVAALSSAGRRLFQEELSAGVYAQAPSPTLGPNLAITNGVESFNLIYQALIGGAFANGTFPERMAILNENEFINKYTSDNDP